MGETVPRDKFDDYLLEMQSKDIFELQGGSVDIDQTPDKIADSVKTDLDGLRCYARLTIDKKELQKKLPKDKSKLEKLLDNPPPLKQLGTASDLSKGNKISSQKDFDKNLDEAFEKINSEFKHNNLVPIHRLREALGDRVSKEDFDKYVGKLVENDKYIWSESGRASDQEEQGGIKDDFGDTKHYLKKL